MVEAPKVRERIVAGDDQARVVPRELLITNRVVWRFGRSMGDSMSTRLFVDPLGNRYVARLTPRERETGGVSDLLNVVVIETDAGAWVGSVGVYPNVRLEDLTKEELWRLLEQALQNTYE
jgi:hypothetical protein